MFGYAKIFQQIFDSSIADDWQIRHVFEDLLILANSDGIIDMTREAIARRTNTPLEIVVRAIEHLELPDASSRSKDENGARLKRLDDHRDWGWWIVNHTHYRDLCTDEQYRAKSRERMRKFRENAKKNEHVTQRNATVTHVTPSRSKKQIADADTKAEEKKAPSAAIFHPPTVEMVKLEGSKCGLPLSECDKFFNFYSSKGWMVGKTKMRSMPHALAGWRSRWQEYEAKKTNGAPLSETVGPTIESTVLRQNLRSVMKGL